MLGFGAEFLVWGVRKVVVRTKRPGVLAFLFSQPATPNTNLLPREVLVLHSPTQMPPPARSLPMYSPAELTVPMAYDG